MHYIRNVVLERIVLENLKEVIQYVSNYEDEFVRMIMDSDMRQRNRELSQKKKRLAEIQKRIGELDTIFQRIYEDNIIGKLSDERFMKMSVSYTHLDVYKRQEMTIGVTAGKIYVTAFLEFKTFKKFSEILAWKTEVWIGDMPVSYTHL